MDFKEGDLVKFSHVKQGMHPQVWNRTEGLGMIVSIREIEGMDWRDLMLSYTVLSNGETFDCIEVHHVEKTMSECEDETEHF
tara:strand:+ start:135 stop:380 length:246 start_codon:yes stop_codon:yes gene_type:complete